MPGIFKLRDGRELKSEDLVWYATFHQGREYNGFDKAVREGGVKAGAAKAVLQTHIRVVVSRRDVSQKNQPYPHGRKERAFPSRTGKKAECRKLQAHVRLREADLLRQIGSKGAELAESTGEAIQSKWS